MKTLDVASAMACLALAACPSQSGPSTPNGAAPLGSEPQAPTSVAPTASASGSVASPEPWKAAMCEPGSAASWSQCCLVHEVELPNYVFSRACSVPEQPTPLWPAGSYPAESEWAGRIVRDASEIPFLAWRGEREHDGRWSVALIGRNTTAGELVIALDGMIFPHVDVEECEVKEGTAESSSPAGAQYRSRFRLAAGGHFRLPAIVGLPLTRCVVAKGNRPLVFYVRGIVTAQDEKPVPFDLRIVRSVDWP